MSRVHLLGVGATSISTGARDPRGLAHDAVAAALIDAGIAGHEVDGLAISAHSQAFARGCREVIGDPAWSTECAGAHGALALHAAWTAVTAEAGEVIVCAAHDPPPGAAPQLSIEALAAAARVQMGESGAEPSHLARVAAKNRSHGVSNRRALLRSEVEPEAVLASEALTWPLNRLMMGPPAQAAAALVLGAHEVARRSGPRAPRLAASVLLSAGDELPPAAARAARLAYFTAGLGPEDIDLVEVEDPTPATEIAAYEALELAPAQRGHELVESGFTRLGGVVPVNVSGGSVCQGWVPGSGALLQLVEIAEQLRGRAGNRQVPGARVGIALPGGGVEGRAATSLTVVSS